MSRNKLTVGTFVIKSYKRNFYSENEECKAFLGGVFNN